MNKNSYGEGFGLGEFNLENFITREDSTNKEFLRRDSRQIVFIVDASNSMRGHKIGAVNESVNNAIAKLKTYSKSRDDIIEIAVIGFSSRLFRWTNGFVPVSGFNYSYVEMVDGKTDINAIFKELTSISNNNMNFESGKIVVLYTDGLPTVDYSEAIMEWKASKHYQDTFKIAVSFAGDISDPQSYSFLKEFVDSGEIINIMQKEKLLSFIFNGTNS